MTQSELKFANLMGRIMMAVAGLGIVVTILFRVWLSPGMINSKTGELDYPWLVMGFMLLCIVGFLTLAFFMGGFRREISGLPVIGLAVPMLLVGLVMAYGELSTIQEGWVNEKTLVMVQGGLGVLGALALVLLAFRLLTEGGTRRGMSQWTMLLPVLWMWLRLVNYEMSDSSLVRLEDGFFGFGMLVLELLFLFKFARYISGVGFVRTGFMLFYSASTALFTLSAVGASVYFYMTNDSVSVQAFNLVSPADFAVGVLALAVGITQLFGEEQVQTEEFQLPEEEFAGEDLIMSSDEDASDIIAE